MTKEPHPLRNGIIIGVSSIVLGAGILWAFGKLPAIARATVSGISAFVGLLQTPIPLWTWFVGVGLTVIAISTRRRWVAASRKRSIESAKKTEQERNATGQAIRQMVQRVFDKSPETPRVILDEPKLDDAKIESVETEEYNDEEEQEDWESYKSDTILDIHWHWRWQDTNIASLTPICPDCGLELSDSAKHLAGGYVDEDRELLSGFECHDEDCGFQHDLEDTTTTYYYYDLVKKHIRRDARLRGYPG